MAFAPALLRVPRAATARVVSSGRKPITRPVQTRVNERIRIREVRLIDEEGQQVGVIQTRDALEMARQRGLDLVEVAPNAIPPVCRLMDYGKFRYEQSRKERESRKNQHVVELKEVRIRPKIDDHDLDTKGRQAAKFLDGGDKVKLTVLFRGREMAHPDIGKRLLDELAEMLKPHGTIEQTPRMEGRTMTMHFAPTKAKQSQGERGGGSGSGGERPPATSNRPRDPETAMAQALAQAGVPNAPPPATAPVAVGSQTGVVESSAAPSTDASAPEAPAGPPPVAAAERAIPRDQAENENPQGRTEAV